MAVWEDEAIHLRLNIFNLDASEVFKLLHFDLVVEVADVSDNGNVLDFLRTLQRDNLKTTKVWQCAIFCILFLEFFSFVDEQRRDTAIGNQQVATVFP